MANAATHQDSIRAMAATRRTGIGATLDYVGRNYWLYVFLLPGLAMLFVFNYIPMYGVVIAFKEFSLVRGIMASPWVGFQNFQYLFQSDSFYRVFRNSVLISLYRLLWGFPAPILLAILLNEVRGTLFKRGVQTIIYLPHFISWVVIAGLVANFLSPSRGIVNHVIRSLGGTPIAFLQRAEYFRSVIVLSEIWKTAGWGTIIYLAAMSGIDPQLYEAAIIDGAGRIARIRHITMPGIMSTVVVLLILRMGHVLRNGFEQIFLLYSPLVYSVADVFETYTYRVGLLEGRFAFATAVGLFQSFIGLALILATNRLAKKYGEGGLW
ncbi:MAG: sugar ABC transporter permease [Spirochaetaceae bacterium]|nr:MAG: sugar ABC transporter permease [Spirochaetaceae bacterium]